MNIVIEVIASSIVQKASKSTGKPFEAVEVAYKKDGKVASKLVMPFGESKTLFDLFKYAKNGETYEVVQEKEGDFWTWKSARPYAPSEAGSVIQAPKGSGTVTTTRSTYETPEERAIRQKLIVRQSSLTNAIETLKVGAKTLNPDQVIELAGKYVNYVFQVEDTSPMLKEVTVNFDDFTDDLPQ